MLVRAYPRLPPEYLDGDWPVARCEEVVRRRREELEPPARRRFQEILDAQPAPPPGPAGGSPAACSSPGRTTPRSRSGTWVPSPLK